MVRIFHKKEGVLCKTKNLESLSQIDVETILWIDLQNPTEEEEDQIENMFSITFRTEQEALEIESSSRYMELQNTIIANSNFMVKVNGDFTNMAVSFILNKDILFSYRKADLRTFADTVKKIRVAGGGYETGMQVFLTIFETRIDIDADLIESIAKSVTNIGRQLSSASRAEEKLLLEITQYQEITMMLRENIVDKQRVIAALLRSDNLAVRAQRDRLNIIIKDIHSLLEHITFSFERLEYLQNTFAGLINLEQNRIIKIFTVISIAFMPAMLIAGIYGMNFKNMPEIEWYYGYPLAICLMVSASVLTLWMFKRNKLI